MWYVATGDIKFKFRKATIPLSKGEVIGLDCNLQDLGPDFGEVDLNTLQGALAPISHEAALAARVFPTADASASNEGEPERKPARRYRNSDKSEE